MAWVLVSLAAAALQTLRFMVQKKLRMDSLSSAGATYARFVYAGPLIVVVAVTYLGAVDSGLPDLSLRFWVFAVVGGITQIVATMCTVSLFQERNFTVGITLNKTEVLLTVIAGIVILGDFVSPWAVLAIAIGVLGTLILSAVPKGHGSWAQQIWNRGTALGLGAGLFFGLCSVAYRGATFEIASGDVLVRSLTTLMMVILVQAALMTVFLRLREPGQIGAVFRAWRTAIWVGLLSLGGSVGWFTAFAMQNAAYVKAVGQVEIIFSLAITTFIFGEQITRREITGVALLLISVVLLVLLV